MFGWLDFAALSHKGNEPTIILVLLGRPFYEFGILLRRNTLIF